MSRIAKNSINISDNVTCKYENGNFYAKGKLGEMTLSVDDLFKVEIKDKEIVLNSMRLKWNLKIDEFKKLTRNLSFN